MNEDQQKLLEELMEVLNKSQMDASEMFQVIYEIEINLSNLMDSVVNLETKEDTSLED